MNQSQKHSELLPNLFRQEYAKMTAVLCRHFGLQHIEIAEDIASDTFLKASEHWAINGTPENPTAWLYAVAKNKMRDYIKHVSVFETQVKKNLETENHEWLKPFEFSEEIISDSQLAMIFAVCNSSNSNENQVCLALQILCGFSVEEIANAFLVKTETIKKRLHRARIRLRNDKFEIKSLDETEIKSRLETVLKTLYLLFNEGYFSGTNNRLIRKELCSEAIRLTLLLAENGLTNTPETNALLALMCYQSSRLDARTNSMGDAIRFDMQDKTLWDKSLINKGNYYLVSATNGNVTSKYHVEAGIAYWHTTDNKNKWNHILDLYNQLILIESSPITALNRTFAFAQVYGPEMAIAEAGKLNLSNSSYYALMGYLYSNSNTLKAIECYEKAKSLTRSESEKRTFAKEIHRLKKTPDETS